VKANLRTCGKVVMY